MKPEITIRTLTDGGQPALEIAAAVAGFIDGAKRTLDLAQYDFDLGPETGAIVVDAIRRAAARGVYIRLAYNVDHARPVPVPPPSAPDEALIATLPVDALPIAGVPDLMHHKYMVRDGESVWTGSTNWTDDSWTRQENVIVVVDSPRARRRLPPRFRPDRPRPARLRGRARSSPSGATASGPGSRPATARISRTGSRRRSAARSGGSGCARRC